jgi:hypothetical protein
VSTINRNSVADQPELVSQIRRDTVAPQAEPKCRASPGSAHKVSEARPGRNRGAIGELWRSGWAYVRWLPDRVPSTASVCRQRRRFQPTAVEAIGRVMCPRPSGIPPAEASRVDRSDGTHALLPAEIFSSTVQLGAPPQSPRSGAISALIKPRHKGALPAAGPALAPRRTWPRDLGGASHPFGGADLKSPSAGARTVLATRRLRGCGSR